MQVSFNLQFLDTLQSVKVFKDVYNLCKICLCAGVTHQFFEVLILRNSGLLLICGNCKMHGALLISDFGNMYLYLFSAQRRKLALSVYSKT